MKYVKLILTKTEYEQLKDKSHAEVTEFVKNGLSPSILYGYGYYGCSTPYEEDGKYYIRYSIGDSCD